MGTTKLTRKEILAEDPIHEGMIRLVGFFQANGKKIGILAVIVVLLAIGIYAGMQYMDQRQVKAQEQFGKGMSFFHAQVAPDAADDPFAKGSDPVFKNDTAKYEAAIKEFSPIAEGWGYSKLSEVARYYMGLSQLQLGRKDEGIKNLEKVGSSSRNRTVSYLARRVLAAEHAASKNYAAAAESLRAMISDPQYDLPKEDLSLDLANVLVAQGKQDEAIKVLKDASTQSPQLSLQKQRLMTELDKLLKASGTEAKP